MRENEAMLRRVACQPAPEVPAQLEREEASGRAEPAADAAAHQAVPAAAHQAARL
jgi:hypothetical protein